MAFIGRDPGTKHTWIITGDSGNGLTHGVLASRILADEIEGKGSPWSKLYTPTRQASILKSAKETLAHDVQINAQYKRFLQSDIHDIEDLPNGEGGVLNPTVKAPVAVYKDDEGKVHKFSALCPHLKGVVCWNRTEKVCHASRITDLVDRTLTSCLRAGTARFTAHGSARTACSSSDLRRATLTQRTRTLRARKRRLYRRRSGTNSCRWTTGRLEGRRDLPKVRLALRCYAKPHRPICWVLKTH